MKNDGVALTFTTLSVLFYVTLFFLFSPIKNGISIFKTSFMHELWLHSLFYDLFWTRSHSFLNFVLFQTTPYTLGGGGGLYLLNVESPLPPQEYLFVLEKMFNLLGSIFFVLEKMLS